MTSGSLRAPRKFLAWQIQLKCVNQIKSHPFLALTACFISLEEISHKRGKVKSCVHAWDSCLRKHLTAQFVQIFFPPPYWTKPTCHLFSNSHNWWETERSGRSQRRFRWKLLFLFWQSPFHYTPDTMDWGRLIRHMQPTEMSSFGGSENGSGTYWPIGCAQTTIQAASIPWLWSHLVFVRYNLCWCATSGIIFIFTVKLNPFLNGTTLWHTA